MVKHFPKSKSKFNPIYLLVGVAYVLPKYEQCVSLQNEEEIII